MCEAACKNDKTLRIIIVFYTLYEKNVSPCEVLAVPRALRHVRGAHLRSYIPQHRFYSKSKKKKSHTATGHND